MYQIQRTLERLLDLSSAHITATSAVVFVGSIVALWVVCNGWGK
ncbi:hypothetical protein Rumeso_02870 [Rubellimicrobium mesophilum DSM 19309]|uniref:Uncharacterized protein n=1 Tax=Rubellimicrobium mesophilum DSM 19309 TaxID=442562 RepID=A0A017HP31_9RHOB|nr:hypothetical protein [Rubellimicrobium mesophilum]EYD75524.1 hypothetical protein Rumeso_02870 [Rubellimicrobium mesophilum DSM 19309]